MADQELALVARAASGDERAFAALLESHKDMVYNLAYRTLGNAADAEDVFQETFVSAFKNLSRFRGDSKFSTWLYRIAVNRCRDFMDSKRARHGFQSIDDIAPEAASTIAKSAGDASETVGEALNFLPADYRIAVNLHCIMGYSYDEAGGIMGVPGGTVKTYVHRGKEMLREVLSRSGAGP